jgi:hypothetical protein
MSGGCRSLLTAGDCPNRPGNASYEDDLIIHPNPELGKTREEGRAQDVYGRRDRADPADLIDSRLRGIRKTLNHLVPEADKGFK